MLQANDQHAETAAAKEAPIPAALPYIAGYNGEDEQSQETAAGGADEPGPPGVAVDTSTITMMDDLATARPARQLAGPLLASFCKLVNEAENIHVFIKTNLTEAMGLALHAVDWSANTNLPTHWTGLVNCAAQNILAAYNDARDLWSQAMDKPPLRLFNDAQQWLSRESEKQ